MTRLVLNLRRGGSTWRFGPEPEWRIFSEWAERMEDHAPTTATRVAALCAGKRVLVIWHGYRVEEPTRAYLRILSRVGHLYDVVVFGFWPGSDLMLGFWMAKRRAMRAGQMAAAALGPISHVAAALDVEGHSLGCRVTLESLACGLSVRNCILAAPAVDDESIQRGERYGYAVDRAKSVLVAYSSRDDVLGGAYYVGSLDRALGLHGAQDRAWCAPHVRFVDCSATADGHSAYKGDPTFLDAWEALAA